MVTFDPFKICPHCSFAWKTRNDFLADPAVEIIGYQVHFANLKLGYFMFVHDVCGVRDIIQIIRHWPKAA